MTGRRVWFAPKTCGMRLARWLLGEMERLWPELAKGGNR